MNAPTWRWPVAMIGCDRENAAGTSNVSSFDGSA